MKRNFSGFSLVELMVVVGIIGILSAIAVPNFKKYQARAKTSEAKLQLSAIYTAEQSFKSDYDTFASCLQTMGYDPSSEALQRYYATGFGVDSNQNNVAITAGAATCSVTATRAFAAGKKVGNSSAIASVSNVTSVAAVSAATTFKAMAVGVILEGFATMDQWTIDETKKINQIAQGY
ncbi:MAG: prepilin-type N-terminal cleavage/methylation domain-containing protein [Oligoflexia bacterium]|nr:prepilin-type N-terminal cleavage/methylation domain-containing protein [Oligoflexia bacterium]